MIWPSRKIWSKYRFSIDVTYSLPEYVAHKRHRDADTLDRLSCSLFSKGGQKDTFDLTACISIWFGGSNGPRGFRPGCQSSSYNKTRREARISLGIPISLITLPSDEEFRQALTSELELAASYINGRVTSAVGSQHDHRSYWESFFGWIVPYLDSPLPLMSNLEMIQAGRLDELEEIYGPIRHPIRPEVSFYCYFPDKKRAKSAAQALEALGYACKLRRTWKDWSFVVTRPGKGQPFDDEVDRVEQVVIECGGEFDGHDWSPVDTLDRSVRL